METTSAYFNQLLPAYKVGENWLFNTKKLTLYHVTIQQGVKMFTKAAYFKFKPNDLQITYLMAIPLGVIKAITRLLNTIQE